jgi:hypothetical protein
MKEIWKLNFVADDPEIKKVTISKPLSTLTLTLILKLRIQIDTSTYTKKNFVFSSANFLIRYFIGKSHKLYKLSHLAS